MLGSGTTVALLAGFLPSADKQSLPKTTGLSLAGYEGSVQASKSQARDLRLACLLCAMHSPLRHGSVLPILPWRPTTRGCLRTRQCACPLVMSLCNNRHVCMASQPCSSLEKHPTRLTSLPELLHVLNDSLRLRLESLDDRWTALQARNEAHGQSSTR